MQPDKIIMTNTSFRPIRKAIFPVAGLGTRFLPATKVMPKEMLPIGDRPLIQHVVEEAKEAGIEEFIFITGRHKNMLEEHFDFQPELMQTLQSRGKEDMLEKVRESVMPEGHFFTTRQAKPLGLGHAIWCARNLINNEPFAVLLPDDLIKAKTGCLKQMIDVYNDKGGNLISLKETKQEDIQKYGIIFPGAQNGNTIEIKDVVEKPLPQDAPSTLSVAGRYILQPEIFDHLEKFERGAGDEIQLTDAMVKLIGQQAFHGVRYEGQMFDCGGRLGFVAANIAYGLDDPDLAAPLKEILNTYNK